jgi:hypothetical protein
MFNFASTWSAQSPEQKQWWASPCLNPTYFGFLVAVAGLRETSCGFPRSSALALPTRRTMKLLARAKRNQNGQVKGKWPFALVVERSGRIVR